MGREFSVRVETVLGGWRLTGTDSGLRRVALEEPTASSFLMSASVVTFKPRTLL